MDSYRSHYRRFTPDNPTAAALCLAICLHAGWARAAPVKPADDATVSALIFDLSADDDAARRAAADKLVQLGIFSRPAVLLAAHSDDPETRAQATDVLLKLPWSAIDDPPPVREILDRYTHYNPDPAAGPSTPSEENRKQAVLALAMLPDYLGIKPLIRLAHEEPSISVRWAILHALRINDDGSHLALARKTALPIHDAPPDAPPDAPRDAPHDAPHDAPLLALYGLAWMSVDSPKAIPLLRQAVDEQLKQPADDGGELDFVINCLVDLEEGAQHYQAAADLLRGQLKRDPPANAHEIPAPLARLLALHADHGPLPHLQDDLNRAAVFADSPTILYARARIDQNQGHPDKAAAEQQAAFNANNASRLGRFQTGQFLSERGWDQEAAAEFKAYLAMPDGDDQDDPVACPANAHFALETLAARRGDDQAAADEEKDAMSILGGGTHADLVKTDGRGRAWPTTEDQMWAEIHWRYLKAAVTRKDDAAIDQQVQALIKLAPNDEDIAIDVVPILKARKQSEAAKHFFTDAYQMAKARLDADPDNPNLMNGLAWLDAKCDENLDEALTLATAAVTALPDNPAAIDTLAEINFHLHKYDQAVKLEERALAQNPGEKFMTGQLARFKAALHR